MRIGRTGPFVGSGADLSAALEREGHDTDEDSNLNDEHACYAHENEKTEKSVNEWARVGPWADTAR